MADFTQLEKKIEYTFKNRALLTEAMTHSSFANEVKGSRVCNERLEFLGDAVLSFVSAEYLYSKFPDYNEGELTKLRSQLVCTKSLSAFAKQISLSDYLIMGRGAALNDAGRSSVLENTFEAVIAAIYLDGGIDEARHFILRFLANEVEKHHTDFKDYKSYFQIVVQRNPDERFRYVLVKEEGPDHDKHYEVELLLNSNIVGRGKGSSKKAAEQDAARQALELMGIEL